MIRDVCMNLLALEIHSYGEIKEIRLGLYQVESLNVF